MSALERGGTPSAFQADAYFGLAVSDMIPVATDCISG
jgi:hypothetical protein